MSTENLSIEKVHLREKVEEWLRKEGYPLEMRIAERFRKAGFAITQSDYYVDPETKQSREIDVVASVQHSQNQLTFRIKFAIECKSSLDKPWLLFCPPEHQPPPAPWKVVQRFANDTGHNTLFGLAQDERVQKLALFDFRGPVGYSLRQAFSKDKDVAYTALCCVANAARAMSAHWNSHPLGNTLAEVNFPVIVIDGKLFVCRLSDGGTPALSETASGTLLWRSANEHPFTTIVDVRTEASIEEFADAAFKSALTLVRDLHSLAYNRL